MQNRVNSSRYSTLTLFCMGVGKIYPPTIKSLRMWYKPENIVISPIYSPSPHPTSPPKALLLIIYMWTASEILVEE